MFSLSETREFSTQERRAGRAPQLGQNPRFLQEKATRRSK